MTEPTATLKRGAYRWPVIAGLGLAYIVAGNYAAWGLGLGVAGWGGMMIAYAVTVVFFFALAFSVAEMAAALPSSGGGYQFSLTAFGPTLAFLTGALLLMEFVCSSAGLAVFLASYVQAVTGLPVPVIIIAAFGVVMILHTLGAGESFGVSMLLACIALAGVLIFLGTVGPAFVPAKLASDNAPLLPSGWYGVWAALPFALTLLISIEGVALAAEEVDNPEIHIPKGMIVTLAVSALLAVLVLTLGPGASGVDTLAQSTDPVVTALTAVHATPWVTHAVGLCAIIGLGAGFFSANYAMSRLIFAFARAGLLPKPLAALNRRSAPAVAIWSGGLIALALALTGAAAQLVVIMVFGATGCYILMLAAFIKLRRAHVHLPRPYRSPGGEPLAWIGLILAAAVFASCFAADIIWSMIGLGLIVAAMAYFLLVLNRRLD